MLVYRDLTLEVIEVDPKATITKPDQLPNLGISVHGVEKPTMLLFRARCLTPGVTVPERPLRDDAVNRFHAALVERCVELGYGPNSVDTLPMHSYGFWELISGMVSNTTFLPESRRHRIRGSGWFHGALDFDVFQAGAPLPDNANGGYISTSEGMHPIVFRQAQGGLNVSVGLLIRWVSKELNRIPKIDCK